MDDTDDYPGAPPRKDAFIIFPSYAAQPGCSPTDAATHAYLTRVKLLPAPIKDLDVKGQTNNLKDALASAGVACPLVLDGYITAKEFQHILAQCVTKQPGVIIIVYCGHGVHAHHQPPGSAQHGIICFSGGSRLSGHDIAKCMRGFTGTLIQLFNMCSAGDDFPVPANVCPVPSPLPSQVPTDRFPYEPTSYTTINVYSCPASDRQQAPHAHLANDTFISLMGTPYMQLQQRLDALGASRVTYSIGGPCKHVTGNFTDPAKSITDLKTRLDMDRAALPAPFDKQQ